MKRIGQALLSILLIIAGHYQLHAQDTTLKSTRPSVALFLPLYLDSAFDAGQQYRYGKQFPKFFNPGLEFYEGAQMAIDTMGKMGVSMDVYIYDTRAGKSVYQYAQQPEFSDIDLIIGSVSNNEIKPLSDIAQKKNIPFINTNLPNDGGVTNNTSMVILNSTLYTHFENIYKFVQKNYKLAQVVVFRKKGVVEDKLKGYLEEIGKKATGIPVKLKYVDLEDNFTSKNLTRHLDSNTTSLCIAGSLDEVFGRNLCAQLTIINPQYHVQVMGMPTWDALLQTEEKIYKGLEIFYSTPFYYAKTDPISNSINTYFKNVLFSRPSDMVFRGYETMFRFGKLLVDYGNNLHTSIGEKKYKVFTDFDIQPVINKQTNTLDYFENKKVYIVKIQDGVVKAVY